MTDTSSALVFEVRILARRQDAITGSSARVCMVAAVHPSHPVETAAWLL